MSNIGRGEARPSRRPGRVPASRPPSAPETPKPPRRAPKLIEEKVQYDESYDLTDEIAFEDLVNISALTITNPLPPCIIPRKRDDFYELPWIRCGICGSTKAANAYIKYTDTLRDKEEDCLSQAQRYMSREEKGAVIEDLLKELKAEYGIKRDCCLLSLKHPMIIPPTEHRYDAPKYRGGFSKQEKEYESLMNMKLLRAKDEPATNPLAGSKMVMDDPDDIDHNFSSETTRETRPEKRILNFPEVPIRGEWELYNEFEDLQMRAETEEYNYIGTAFTGVSGYSTKVIRKKRVIAK